MRTCCFGSMCAVVVLTAGVLSSNPAIAGEDFHYPVSTTASYTAGLSYETSPMHAHMADRFRGVADRRSLVVASGNDDRVLRLSSRLAVGNTFDGFGLRFDMGEVQLAFTNDGFGARWQF